MVERWLVLFDIDGTLLHPGGCGRAATELALYELVGTVGALDRVNFAGKTDWGILLEALTPAGFSAETVRTVLPRYDQAVSRHLEAIIDHYEVRPCVGALEVVAALRGNSAVVLGLVTGNMPALVPIKLRRAGFDPAEFRVGAFGSEGADRSQLPPLALARAEALVGGRFAPEQIVIIGDTPGDIVCARSVGARTIGVATGPYTVSELSPHGPTTVLESLADRESVLRAIFDGNQS